MEDSDEVADEIRAVLATINGAWLSTNLEAVETALQSCFHRDMVIKGGDLETAAEGRKACVRSYIDFIDQAKISEFKQDEPDIRIFGNTAIASYSWRIGYSMGGKDYDEKGWDIFAFMREDGKWLAVWRAMLNEG
jgi:ketosteroid isomerase-like protein